MSKSNVWLARNQVNVRITRQICPWTAVSVSHQYLNRTHRVACSIDRTHRVACSTVQSGHYHRIVSSRHYMAKQLFILALNNNPS
jgi:hypothetical protein